MAETIPVRAGEEFDREAVHRYLRAHLPDIPDAPLAVEQFPAGASNLTYLLRCGEWQAVLRRPPFGPVPPKAHDMEREAAILKRLHPHFPLAPRPLLFCGDEGVIGAPFYVMERRHGVTLEGELPPGYDRGEAGAGRISALTADTLAELHRVDYRAAGLAQFGRPEGFLRRQLEGWLRRYERARTEEAPDVDRLAAWFRRRLPRSRQITVIHNDFKLNNILLAPALDEVRAVLDWEMATLGDPLLDLGVTLGYWVVADDPPPLRDGLPAVTTRPGFWSRREFAERYARQTGRDLSALDFYLTFAYFKLAVIVQQIYHRWRQGQTQDPRFAPFGRMARELVLYATSLADGQAQAL